MLGLRVNGLDLPRLVHRLQLVGVQAELMILCEQALLVSDVQRVVPFQVTRQGSPVLPQGRARLLLSVEGLKALIGGDVFHTALPCEGQVVHQVHVVVGRTQPQIFIASGADASEAPVQLRGGV